MWDPRRLTGAGIVVAAVEATLGVGLLVLVGGQRVSTVLLVSAVVTAALSRAARPLLRPAPGGDDEPPARDGGGDPEPPWWPDFERELDELLRERDRLTVP